MKYLTAAFLFLFCVAQAFADTSRHVAVTGPGGEFEANFTASLRDLLPGEIAVSERSGEAGIVVALGDRAFSEAVANERPTIGMYVSERIVTQARASGCTCTAVWSHPALTDQLDLIRELMPGARRVGVLHAHPIAQPGEVERRAEKLGLLLVTSPLNDRRPAVALAELMPRVDVLLAISDPELYNPANARVVLMTSYRQNRPVVGPDEKWVKAGSLASAWVDDKAQLDELVAMLAYYLNEDRLPPPVHPAVRTIVNPHVAEAFQVPIPDDPVMERLEVVQ